MFENFAVFINKNLGLMNVLLILIILFFIMDFFYEVAWLVIFLLPYFLLTYKWNLGLLERMLLSLPLAALFTNVLYLLSVFGLPLPLPFIYLLLLIFPTLFAFIFYREKIKSDLNRLINLEPLANRNLMFVLLILIVSLYAYQGFLSTTYIQKTDAMSYLARIHFVKTSLEYYEIIFSWYDKEKLGYPMFTFDPPQSFIFGGTYQLISHGDLRNAFNLIFLFFIILMALGVFLLNKAILKDPYLSFISTIIFIINPVLTLNSAYVGNYKLFSAFAAMSVALYFIIRTYQVHDNKYLLPIALLIAYAFLSHPSVGLVLLSFLMLSWLVYSFKSKSVTGIGALFGALKFPMKVVFIFFFLVAFFVVPIVIYSGHISKITFELGSVDAINLLLLPLFSEPEIKFTGSNNLNVGLFYGIFVTLGLIILGREAVKNKRNELHTFTFIFILTWLVIFLGANISDTISKTIIGIDRMMPFFAFFYAIIIVNFFDKISSNPNLVGKFMVLLILVIFILHYLFITHEKTIRYVTDKGLIDSIDYLKKVFGRFEGRVITYGTYGTTLHPLLAISGISTNGLGFVQGQHTDIYLNRLTDIYGNDWGLPNKTTMQEAFKLFKMTDVTRIFVDTCNDGGMNFLDRVDICKECRFKEAIQVSNCAFVISLENSFIDGFDFVPTEQNYDWRVAKKLDYVRPNPQEILIKNPRSKYLFVKEEYFPNWHAYQNGFGQVPVVESDVGLMIVENKNGNDILLRYELPLWEKSLFLISISGMIFLIFYPKDFV